MSDRKVLPRKIAEKIYNILVAECGAPEGFRSSFLLAFSDEQHPSPVPSEWRFSGSLGFGGKFWWNDDRFYITCYKEDETEEMRGVITRVNHMLEEIYVISVGPSVQPGRQVLINYNDETGEDLYSVEYKEDIGNWIDSFEDLEAALRFVNENGLLYDHEKGFRDTRYPHRH